MRLTRLALGLLLLAPVAVHVLADEMTASLTAAIETMIVVAIATIWAERQIDSRYAFSPCSTAAVLYPVHFGLPFVAVLFLGENAFFLARPDQLAGSAWVVAIGLALHGAGYLFVRSLWVRRRPAARDAATADRPLESPRALARFTQILVALDLLGKAIRIAYGAYFQTQIAMQGEVPLEIWPVVMLISSLGFGAFAIAYAAHLSSPGSRWGKAAALIWGYNFAFNLPTGRKESLLFLLILPLLVRGLHGRKLGQRWMLPAVALGAVAVFTFSTIYRAGMQATDGVDSAGVSAATISEMFERGRAARSGDGLSEYLVDGVTAMLSRLSLIESVYATLELNPAEATLGGETLLWVLESLAIPRALWPDKPNMHLGNDFGRRFGFIASDDTLTSVSVTYIGEFIWNFGPWGVVIMFGLGALNAALFSLVMARRTPERIGVYALIWLPVAYVGGEFAMYYAGIVKTLVVLSALWWIARRTAGLLGRTRRSRLGVA
jgi:hypothetical protein